MLTYQDYLTETQGKSLDALVSFLRKAINEHRSDPMVKIAQIADTYDAQLNETIINYSKLFYTFNGRPVVDTTASNNKLASNFFHRLNVQRNTYLLGNGVTFTKPETKDKLGANFDTAFKKAGYNALIHGLTFVFWNYDRLFNFKLAEFVPLWDEADSSLRAGIRYWQLDANKPLNVVLYEEDGYTKFVENKDKQLVQVEQKHSYITRIMHTELDGDVIVGEFNYSYLPIIPFWGTPSHQSTLVGMRANIDAYDLIKSGFANDLDDCAQAYWLLSNASGMDDVDLQQFRDRLKLAHIAKVDRDQTVTPFTQEVPFTARETLLTRIKSDLYEDFGALDVHTVAAGATNDHIDAAYQPLDEEADDYEYQCTECIQQILGLQGIEDDPIYKRNRISNHMEQVQMLMMEAPYLDEETLISKLPNITVDEVKEIMKRKDSEDMDRFMQTDDADSTEEEPEEEAEA